MQGNAQVLETLNRLLTLELTAINQYFVHTKMCANWGYDRLGEHLRKIALEEMHDAEEIIERILFLDGVPNLQRLEPLPVGENVSEQLRLGLETELRAVAMISEGVKVCLDVGDQATREFLAGRLQEEEGHVDWLETQLSLLGQLGEANYLAQQIRG